ncbi:hypothetical protein TNCV_4830051 [Trichonephila clavipes]|nr:hypothetical protein TNCV_4830051 [Trichonephila clavipes]
MQIASSPPRQSGRSERYAAKALLPLTTEREENLKRLVSRDQQRSDSRPREREGDFPGERKEDERRWCWKIDPNNFLEIWASALWTKQSGEVIDLSLVRD